MRLHFGSYFGHLSCMFVMHHKVQRISLQIDLLNTLKFKVYLRSFSMDRLISPFRRPINQQLVEAVSVLALSYVHSYGEDSKSAEVRMLIREALQ